LTRDGSRWVSSSPDYLFPVLALSAVFRGKFCAGLQQLYAAGQLQFHGQLAALAGAKAFQGLLRQATRRAWVVYAKRPFAGPRQVLAYLSRYTHRVAIGPSRLLVLDRPNHTVTFAWKDYADGARRKTMTLGAGEFVRRFCLHLLPVRFVKIRHYGLLGNRQRQSKVAQAWVAIVQGPRWAVASELLAELPLPAPVAPPLPVCPFCGSARLWLVEVVLPCRHTAPPGWDSS